MDLICNKLTFLEGFIKQMIEREPVYEMTHEQCKSYLKTAFEDVIRPELQRIREASERMELGLQRRKGFMIAIGEEDLYQRLKKQSN